MPAHPETLSSPRHTARRAAWPAQTDPVHDAQKHFRQLLAAMAEPGTLHDAIAPAPSHDVIGAALWGTLLTLCDLDTAVWFDARLDDAELNRALTFLTGTKLADHPAQADFAVVLPDTPIAALGFSQGTRAWPDRSTTLLVAVPQLNACSTEPAEPDWRLTGPGIATQRYLSIGPASDAHLLRQALTATRSDFPLGLDAILTCGEQFTALPRSTRLARADTARIDTPSGAPAQREETK